MPHPFALTNEINVDATPEEVWDAITTGPGMDAWFMGKNQVQPGEGGTVRTELPGFGFEGTITTWEPPTRFAERSPEGKDGSVHAFVYTFDASVGLGHHIFTEGLDQEETEEAWRSWLNALFA